MNGFPAVTDLERNRRTAPHRLSVVVPCYNEQESLAACHARLQAVLGGLEAAHPGLWWEVLYVDDGSRDRTSQLLRALWAADSHVNVIFLSRNFGHQPAVTAGLEHARGDAILILDADLQDPPEVLPRMLELWREGCEVVYGVRAHRAGESRFKLWTAKLFYRMMSYFSDVEIPLDAGDFRLLDRRVVDALLQMPERQRLLRAMCSWVGFRQVGLRYQRDARFAGSTKYPLGKMINLAFDGIFSFSVIPLRMLTYMGLITASVAFAGVLWALFVRLFTHHWVLGWATLFGAILFLSGLQMISLGIIGEYIGRIYTEVKQRPLYIIGSVLGTTRMHEHLGVHPTTSMASERV
jgi:dolichol-phosphate mannosyltransferase